LLQCTLNRRDGNQLLEHSVRRPPRQQAVIEYLRTENQVLKEKLGKKRILLDDDQRRRLAVKGKLLGRKLLEELVTIRPTMSYSTGFRRSKSSITWPRTTPPSQI